MKKLIFLAAFLVMTVAIFGQTLQKGNVIGMHVGTMILDPNVTYNQFKDFWINKFIPEWDKQFKGDIKLYLAEGDRGADVNCISVLYVFKSVEVRDKYFNKEGASTELMNSIQIDPSIMEAFGKLGTYSEKHYTDWIIQ